MNCEVKTFTLTEYRQHFISCIFPPDLLTSNEIGESSAESGIF
jgi:hypothetical protein